MPWSKPTQFTAWSFSRLQAYRKCPLAARLEHIDKIAQPKSLAMERGTAIHKIAEDYLKGAGRTVPKELKAFGPELSALRKLRKKDEASVVVEEMWVFRKDWGETVWNDWGGAWCRVKLDVAKIKDRTIVPIDLKTGKYSPQWNVDDYMDQVELYAMAALIKYADIGSDLRVTPLLYFLDAGVMHPPLTDLRTYTLLMLPGLKHKWEKAVKPMLNDKAFAPKPNRFCSSCWYRKGNAERMDGGQVCKFN